LAHVVRQRELPFDEHRFFIVELEELPRATDLPAGRLQSLALAALQRGHRERLPTGRRECGWPCLL